MKKIFSFIFRKPKNGYTMLETVVYIGVLSVAVLAVFTILSSIMHAFADSRIYNEVEASGSTAMERMVREIRTAQSVDDGNSVLDVNAGELQLNTTDDAGAAKTVKFYFDDTNDTVNIIDNGNDKGSLTGDGVTITKLLFRKWVTVKSALIKIEMTVQSKKKPTLSETYYDSVVLRGAY